MTMIQTLELKCFAILSFSLTSLRILWLKEILSRIVSVDPRDIIQSSHVNDFIYTLLCCAYCTLFSRPEAPPDFEMTGVLC
jgi:hypothetical protein